ncbi:hypothetical protein Fot_19654 [Forsythia ovata]|uniref:Uncharacterized protein n=1 Tax=Forsythia ovata TaxID=205694 RepID=A0ABD1VNP7_9LAMI
MEALRTCLERAMTYSFPQQQEKYKRWLAFKKWGPYELVSDERWHIACFNNKQTMSKGANIRQLRNIQIFLGGAMTYGSLYNKKTTSEGSFSTIRFLTNLPSMSDDL